MGEPVVDGPGSERAGGAGGRGAAEGPTLPYARAFVVLFTAETDIDLQHAAGRVEHLQTGRRSRFASVVDLVACIVKLLGDDAGEPPGGAGPATEGGPGQRSTIETGPGQAPPAR
jgi:hypothetical protein